MDDLDPFDFTVHGTDYVIPAPDWNGKPFKIQNQKDWWDSVHRCYTNLPKETLKRFKFVYKMDTEEQTEVKTKAAVHAYSWVMDKFDEEFSDIECDDVRAMVESQADYFFCCLRTFHPITMHCKVLDFEQEYPNAQLYVCPFGKGAAKWRTCYSLEYLVEGKACESCEYDKPQTIADVRTHLNRYGAMFFLHEGVGQYVKYCEEHLIDLAPQVVDRKHGNRIIRTLKSDNNKVNLNYLNASETTSQGTGDTLSTSDPPAEIICDNKSDDDGDATLTIPKKDKGRNDAPKYTTHSSDVLKKKASDAKLPRYHDYDKVVGNESETAKPIKPSSDNGNSHSNRSSTPTKSSTPGTTKCGYSHGGQRFMNRRGGRGYSHGNHWRGNKNNTSSNGRNFDMGSHYSHGYNPRYDNRRRDNVEDYSRYGPGGGYNSQNPHNNRNRYGHYNTNYPCDRYEQRVSNRHQQYRDDIADTEMCSEDTMSNISQTGKRSYGDSEGMGSPKESEKKKRVDEPVSNQDTKGAESAPANTESTQNQLLTSVITLIKTLAENQVQNQMIRTDTPTKKKNQRTVVNKAAVTFEGKPLYLLVDECLTLRTASNGNQFTIQLVDTKNDGKLPVPVWYQDKRGPYKLGIQAKRNKNSRDKILQYAKDIGNGVNPDGTHEEGRNSSADNCNKNQSSKYFPPKLVTNILLIGMSYNRSIIDQLFNDPSISNISECTDQNGRIIDQCVARDTYRCYILEATYPNVKIYTVNRCTDIVRLVDNDTDPYNINSDVGTSQFIKLLKKKHWTFTEVYLDTIRMNKSYVEYNFGKNFFNNLVSMRTNGILIDGIDRSCKIYLQFTPHFFHMVHSHVRLLQKFEVTYLKEDEINIENHKLGYTVSCNNDFMSLQKNLDEEKRHMVTTKHEVLDYDCGFLLTKEDCKNLLEEMGDVSLIRYIVLTGKKLIKDSNDMLSNYSCHVIPFLTSSKIPLKSKQLKFDNVDCILQMGLNISRGLVINPPDSFYGISIVADAPECNDVMLNVSRPGVLRQYYGMDVGIAVNNTINRIAYRSQVCIKSEGSDPQKLVIKPFTADLYEMANYLAELLRHNKKKLDLELADLSNDFNSCTILLYHSLHDIKKESSMGWHTDSKHSLAGNFSLKTNGQLINTPVVIFTVCGTRMLHWRKRKTVTNERGNKIWVVDDMPIQKMVFEKGDLCIINPHDEKPHFDDVLMEEIHFQHGKTRVNGENISIAMVFRVSPHKCKCDVNSNKVMLDESIISDIKKKEHGSKINQRRRQEIYNKFDPIAYHDKLVTHFENFFNK